MPWTLFKLGGDLREVGMWIISKRIFRAHLPEVLANILKQTQLLHLRSLSFLLASRHLLQLDQRPFDVLDIARGRVLHLLAEIAKLCVNAN